MNALILTGLILGISSNLHCLGMCGPIAMSIPVNRKNNLTIFGGTLQYNFGRITTYFVLGLLVGSIGLTVNTFGFLQWLSIITGIIIIVYAWRKYLARLFKNPIQFSGIQRILNNSLGKIIKSQSPFKLLFLGGLNGLLPCGMVFAALLNALLTGEMLYSGLAMVAFGVGTLPAMIGVTFMANKINPAARKKLSKIVPYLLTVVGVLVVLRGMNLDIPYLSPEVKITAESTTENSSGTQLEMSCCHAKDDCE